MFDELQTAILAVAAANVRRSLANERLVEANAELREAAKQSDEAQRGLKAALAKATSQAIQEMNDVK